MALSTIGTDPDYASLLGGGNRDPRLLMAQKLMDVGAMPTNNSTQSSFWANLLNQGARGALGGYLYNEVKDERTKEAAAQEKEAAVFNRTLAAGPPGGSSPKGGGDAAPAAPAPQPQASLGGDGGGDLVAAVHHLESRSRMAPGIMGDGGAAAGPMQVHAGALADVNRAQGTNYTHEQLAANPELGLKVGAAYLAQLRQQFGRDDYALGAYNAGPGAMRAAIASGKGVAGLPARTQQYVTEGLSRMQGRQADASPPPGSNIDALMAGVNQPKPRGIQLAESLFPGTATDAPTPILPDMGDAQGTAVPRVPVASAALDAPGAAAPAMQPPDAAAVPGANLALPASPDAAALPLPSPAVVPPPAAAPSPPPDLMPGAGPAPAIVPAPDAASVPTPDLANAAPVPAIVPQPDAAAVPQPTPALVPDNPMSRADPASLAAFNGAPPAPTPAVVPPPDPAIVPPPAPAMVPRPAAATLPPVQGPPVPPELLARKLQQAAPDNATEALNTASLAAARAGQNFDPRAPTSPTGPQLAAPLMSWAGNLTDAGAPLLTPAGAAGGPTGPQLAAPLQPPGAPGAASQQGGPVPLVTPASGPGDATGATTDTSATGGPSKGAAPSAPATAASTADAQAKADWYLTMARQAQASSNPRIRAQAGMLEAQGQALQRRIDQQTLQAERATERRDARETAAANRNLPIHDLTLADGKVHSVQIMPDGSQRDLGLSGNQHAQAERNPQHITVKVDGKNYVHTWNPGTGKYENTGLLAEKQDSEGGGRYPGKDATSTDLNILDAMHDKIVSGKATEDEKREYSRSYNRLQSGADYDAPDPLRPGQNIRVPGHPTDLTGYTPPPYRDTSTKPGKAPTEAERKDAGYARRMDLANAEIDQLGTRTFGDVLAGRVPMLGNYLTSDQGQQFRTAADAWIMAKLRPESGAVIGKDELQQNFEIYFPMPGDSPARIALKKRLRDLETESSRQTAGNAYTRPEPSAPGGGGGGAPVRITSDAEFDKLQPGQQFIGPDGKTRTK